ncbi:hypothetical protein JL720_6729 [Aureococcus anophagefferens]|nr:hypothetical protein JL720_6729 [Aureococcus anophagefferens]
MVKGNWQHRVEKAERRKAERKERKELREKGLLVEPLDVLNALFRGDPDPEVWLVAPERPKLCAAHFFDDGCTNRRCKWSHAETLGPYTARCAVAAPTETTARAVARLARVDEQLFPARVAPGGAAAPLLRAKDVAYAASGAALAFDAGADDVWRSFAGGAAPRPRARSRGDSAADEARRAVRPPFCAVSSERPFRALLACCPDASAAGLAAGSKALRAAAKADPAMRARRRRGLEAAAAWKKQGQKKKQGKSSGGKKDGFARGQ